MEYMKRVSKEYFFSFLKTQGKHISTAFFVGGFISDYFFLPKTDSVFTPYIGTLYLIGFAFALFGRSTLLTKAKGDVFGNKITTLFSLLLAYFSGSILSYVFILYFRSALVAASLPFLSFALFAMFANEFVRTKEYRTYLDLCVFFFALTSVAVFVTPYIIGSVTFLSFAVAIVVSLALSFAFIWLLLRYSSNAVVGILKPILLAIWAPLLFIFLYSTESLPPLPVSLSSAKIYHSIERVGDEYRVKEEEKQKVSSVYHVIEGSPLYFFSTIYAPVTLSAPITHAWEYYNEDKGEWQEKMRVDFTIVGGRKDGYRGYSMLTGTMPGKWRVNVYLDNKRLIGRHYFSLESTAPTKLVESAR